jgi:hypothetical protein
MSFFIEKPTQIDVIYLTVLNYVFKSENVVIVFLSFFDKLVKNS